MTIVNPNTECSNNVVSNAAKEAGQELRSSNPAAPLTAHQKAIWFLDCLDGAAKIAYNEPLIFSLTGELSLLGLNHAFNAIIQREPIFRTVFFKDESGNPTQLVRDQTVFNINYIETTKLSADTLQGSIEREVNTAFNLTEGPLIRVTLYARSQSDFMLVIVQHHLITDAITTHNLIKSLNSEYNNYVNNSCNTQSETEQITTTKPILLPQYTHSKISLLATLLEDYQALNLLTTPNSNSTDYHQGNRYHFKIDSQLFSQINIFCKQQKITLFNFLYACFVIFLNKYARSEDIVVGIPFANRKNKYEREYFGFFANTLPVRIKFNQEDSFLQLISKASETISDYLSLQSTVIEDATITRDRKAGHQHPLIQTFFSYSDASDLTLDLNGTAGVIWLKSWPKAAKFDLSLYISKFPDDTFSAYFEYRTCLFEHGMVVKFSEYLLAICKSVLDNPNQTISAVSLLDNQQLAIMKEQLFTSKLDRIVTTSLSSLFKESAQLYPDRIALIYQNEQISYKELDLQSDQLAAHIQKHHRKIYDKDISANSRMGICFERGLEMIIAILAVLKCGAAYVPFDLRQPKDRLEFMLSDSQVCLLLCQQQSVVLFNNMVSDQLIIVDEPETAATIATYTRFKDYKIDPKSVAYILYTSGSTGKPKGVLVTHENVICLFRSLKLVMSYSKKDVWTLFHTYCFDISIWEIWGALLFGGKLVIVPYLTTQDPALFYQLIQKERVTVLTQTSSAFQMLINEDQKYKTKLQSLRYVAFVGESLKVAMLQPWTKKYGVQSPLLVNLYGITETTVYTNYKFIDSTDISKGRDNIGKPLNEFSMCVMDDNLKWCPIGIVGEIYIGGRGLSKGYLNRPDLNEDKFIIDPYANALGLPANSKLYRTGDLGRWLEDGSIEYLGRKDFQVKLRGFRIELGEIEAMLGSYPGISHSTVLLKGEGEHAHLAAYYTVKAGEKIDSRAITRYLSSFLPSYMIPQVYVELQTLPMTANGKIDRRYLERLTQKKKAYQSRVKTNEETQVAALWSKLLNIDSDHIFSDSNFFELGGNSLLAVRMLHLLSKSFMKEVSASQFIAKPDLRSVTQQLTNKDHYSAMISAFSQRISSDILLPIDITAIKNETSQRKSSSILLTGATGFLGIHVLHALLEQTQTKIYCLVRANSIQEGLATITAKLKQYKLFSSDLLDRVIPVLGDLSKNQLGVSNEDYAFFIEEISAIYHVGAKVNHVFDYASLYNTNVNSVLELLKIATQKNNKTLHFISTFGTQSIAPLNKPPASEKESRLENFNGYLCTKWVAEQLIMQARERGIGAYIYRPGNIVQGKAGIDVPEDNHILLRLKSYLQLQKAYLVQDDFIEMMPVDLLANYIVAISLRPKKDTYNLHNKNSISWDEYINYAKDFGYHIETITNEDEWLHIMDKLNEDNALFKLSLLYRKGIIKQAETTIQPDHDMDIPPYQELVTRQLQSLILRGFLHKP